MHIQHQTIDTAKALAAVPSLQEIIPETDQELLQELEHLIAGLDRRQTGPNGLAMYTTPQNNLFVGVRDTPSVAVFLIQKGEGRDLHDLNQTLSKALSSARDDSLVLRNPKTPHQTLGFALVENIRSPFELIGFLQGLQRVLHPHTSAEPGNDHLNFSW